MSMDTGAFRLYLITDRKTVPQGRTLLQCVEQALCGGVRAVQLRDKDLPADELYRCGLALRSLTARFGARLLVNDRIDVALATGADGVHLGEHSLPTAEARRLLGQNAIIGRSVHHPEAIHPAAQEGADFVTFSPIYFTPSKAPFGAPQGLEALRCACACSPLPVLALGGIQQGRIREVRAAGAAGVALISAILAAANPEAATRALLAEMDEPLA
ncbi:MAG: thiamine phosphate synthase [Syntrophotalea acetylenica]|jgi:thiamine-phosphate pyrophosphorylase|nr:thiamine phosphate synthase [Syntrophotalea acetylenica]MDY0262601.1 thiamine phosphate synthase [Syntrophotalea acetylenica]